MRINPLFFNRRCLVYRDETIKDDFNRETFTTSLIGVVKCSVEKLRSEVAASDGKSSVLSTYKILLKSTNNFKKGDLLILLPFGFDVDSFEDLEEEMEEIKGKRFTITSPNIFRTHSELEVKSIESDL